MNNYFTSDEWKVMQNGFNNDINEISESLTSLGNGHMGIRGNFEEDFTGSSLKGTRGWTMPHDGDYDKKDEKIY